MSPSSCASSHCSLVPGCRSSLRLQTLRLRHPASVSGGGIRGRHSRRDLGGRQLCRGAGAAVGRHRADLCGQGARPAKPHGRFEAGAARDAEDRPAGSCSPTGINSAVRYPALSGLAPGRGARILSHYVGSHVEPGVQEAARLNAGAAFVLATSRGCAQSPIWCWREHSRVSAS